MHRLVLALLIALVCPLRAGAGPTIFPVGLTVIDPQSINFGVTLYPAPNGVTVLIDPAGNFIHTWSDPSGHGIDGSEPIESEPGHILTRRITPNTTHPPASGGLLTELDWQSNVVWEVAAPSTLGKGEVARSFEFHHDMERLANANTLALCRISINVPAISSKTLQDDCIVEYDAAGNLVWSWFLFEHFDELGFSAEAKALIAAAGGDWAHANSLSVLPQNPFSADPRFTPGNLLVSLRTANVIFIIDKVSGHVVWQMGPDDALMIGQHWPHMIEPGLPGEGELLVFDNGGSAGYPERFRSYSRVVEIDPVARTIVREYNALNTGRIPQTFFSHIISGAQRLPNGNTLVVEGTSGRLFELDLGWSKIVWEFINPFFGPPTRSVPVPSPFVYRAYRLPVSWIPAS